MQNDNLIFGINPIMQLIATNPQRVLEISISSSKQDQRSKELIRIAKENNIAVHNIDVKKLDKIFNEQNHQGVMAKITPTPTYTEVDLRNFVKVNPKPLFLILDEVQDPHNLGACLRTADAAGVTAVIIPRDNSVGITPVVRKVSSGAADTVPVVRVANLARTMRELQELGVWIVGTAAETEQLIYEIDLNGPLAIVLGAEGEGMRELTRKHCDFLAKLPMLGTVSSLNVSVACGICLFEALRQRAVVMAMK